MPYSKWQHEQKLSTGAWAEWTKGLMMYSCLICSAALNHAQPKYGEIELKSNTDVPHPYFFRPPKKKPTVYCL